MLDFLIINTRNKRGVVEIYPKFVIKNSKDLMIRGGDFYAIWIEERGLWSTNEEDVIHLIDSELNSYAKNHRSMTDDHVKVLYMWDAESGIIDTWHKYCQKQLRDNYKPLDEKLIFANQETKKEDYATKKLSYPLEDGNIDAYSELISTLYSQEERHKIEWGIGAVVTGASKYIHKFITLYGPPGTGKSTILNVIQSLFDGYYSVFDAESLGSSTDLFALEQFKSNPLVAISHDGDLSRIERNTKLNSLVSHERMIVNEKHRSIYSMRFNSFLFLGTNKPVRITDAKSGLIRRLIDVHPTGNKIPLQKYNRLIKQINFELGQIANHCKNVYLDDPGYYDDYKPTMMMGESNDFYNFMLDAHAVFKKEDGTSLKAAWEMYKTYCEDAKVPYPMSMRNFKSELKTYFTEYEERVRVGEDWVRSYYKGFKTDIFEQEIGPSKKKKNDISESIEFIEQRSILDEYCAKCPAQYANESGTPVLKWVDVTTILSDIDTSKVHYLKVPENLIVIDFDIEDENGNKSFEKSLEEANKWPKTYAELSKSGQGIHLHYIYKGDVSQVSRLYANNIEIKIFTGNSSLRRKLTKCNSEKIAQISSGLPLREVKLINFDSIKTERALRTIINKNLNKEYHPATKPSIDFIFKVLEDAYQSGMKYDLSDMFNILLAFAASSTHQSDYCMKLVGKMRLKSEEPSDPLKNEESPIVFFDIEVFQNFYGIVWKILGSTKKIKWINPTAKDVESLLKYRLVGFNNRGYDNHILYGILIGYSVDDIYKLSQRIINDQGGKFSEAYNISYTDVYDYSSDKKSLKKWQVELNIKHKELDPAIIDWNKPVDPKYWDLVMDYCANDVDSLEIVWHETKDDFTCRQILADITGLTVNDTTNSLTARLLFGNDRHPQLNYVDLSVEFPGYKFVKTWNDKTKRYDKYNMYRGVNVGFGGYVYAEPGIYGNVAMLDVVSQHPHSALAMQYFGKYTPRLKDLIDVRVYLKHGEYDKARMLFDGKLDKYLVDSDQSKKLSKALKVPLVSIAGMSSAQFDNVFKDPRNENNIMQLRGALFMKTLQDEVANRGFTVVHIKTDSIKIADATKEIIDFCMWFAKDYGYTFEHESSFDKIALVNDAVYISKYMSHEKCNEIYGYIPEKNLKAKNKWDATGTQFQIPYVFKECFSKEQVVFRDLCELKSVQKSVMYLNMNEGNYVDEDTLKFVGRVGLFCPIKPGHGGGELVKPVQKKDGTVSFDSVTGAKGYRWLEAEEVEEKGLHNSIDLGYYKRLVDNAIDAISKFGDYEWFVSEDPYIAPEIINGRPSYNN